MKKRSVRYGRRRVSKRRRLQANNQLAVAARNTAIAAGAAYTLQNAAPFIRGAYNEAQAYRRRQEINRRRVGRAPPPPARRNTVRGSGRSGRGGELSYVKSRGGRRRGLGVNKLQLMSLARTNLRFQGVNRMNNSVPVPINADGTVALLPPGYYKLSLAPNGAGNQAFPLHVYDLTVVPNTTNTNYSVAHRMQISDTGNIVWQNMNGTDPSGTFVSHYSVESQTMPRQSDGQAVLPVSGFATKYIRHEGFDIRLNAYGARAQPTWYDIMIVRFNEDHLVPLVNTTDVLAANTEDQHAYHAMYQQLVKSLAFNPIMPGIRNASKGMHVLKRVRFQIAPSSTTEVDRNPSAKIVKLQYNDFRTRNHSWGPAAFSSDAAVNSASYPVDPAAAFPFRDVPQEKARLFLIVRASNTTPIVEGTTETADNTPSYDIVIRKTIRHREQS
jgi:hypothetical protein